MHRGEKSHSISTTVINRRPQFHCAQRGSQSLKYLCLVTEVEMIINAGCKARSKESPEFLSSSGNSQPHSSPHRPLSVPVHSQGLTNASCKITGHSTSISAPKHQETIPQQNRQTTGKRALVPLWAASFHVEAAPEPTHQLPRIHPRCTPCSLGPVQPPQKCFPRGNPENNGLGGNSTVNLCGAHTHFMGFQNVL